MFSYFCFARGTDGLSHFFGLLGSATCIIGPTIVARKTGGSGFEKCTTTKKNGHPVYNGVPFPKKELVCFFITRCLFVSTGVRAWIRLDGMML